MLENVVWILAITAFSVHTLLYNVCQSVSVIRKNSCSIKLATHLRLMSSLKMRGALPPFSPLLHGRI